MKGLTPKQQRIWDMKRPVDQGGEGKTRGQIAAELGISEPVVGKQISVIHKKLGVKPDPGSHKRVENAEPEKAAAAIVAMTDPYGKVLEACRQAGLPDSTAKQLIRRLEVKYHRVVTEVRNLQTKELSDLIGKKLHLMLGYLDDKVVSEASARDLAMGIAQLVEKRQLLRGEPTQIVSDHERKKLHELAPLLLEEVKRRGLTLEGTVTEKVVTPA